MLLRSDATRTGPRPLTGYKVLAWLVCFFGFVFAVNGVMVHYALSTLGGVETPSSYRAGQVFEDDIHAAERQTERHWQVSEHLRREADGAQTLTVTALDAMSRPQTGLVATVTLHHPVDARLDREVAVHETSGGVYEGRVDAPTGRWDVVLELARGDSALFRSRNRIEIR